MAEKHIRRIGPNREAARGRILAAAVYLYHRHGIEAVTFGQVARRARLSRPLVYFYFPDQRSLLLEAVLEALVRLRRRFEAVAGAAADGLQATRALGRAYLDYHTEEPAYFHLCMAAGPARRSSPRSSALERLLVQEEQAVMGLLVGCVERGMADGSIRRDRGSPLVLSLCLWALTHGLAQCSESQQVVLADYGVTPPDLLRAGLDLLTSALQVKTDTKSNRINS